jgi:hypothetical protein
MELRRDILSSKRIDEDSESEDESAVEYVEDGAYIANGEEDDSDIDSEEIDGPESGFIELEAEESLDDEVDEDDVDGDDEAMDEDDEELNGE